ncbi:hypothetical protein NIES4073_33900 [Kalymmatonema gypsitolerans NIES-4073]|nr:hypothetical protein NIES4073_33900 [Scytonema sp. NIES-4073]
MTFKKETHNLGGLSVPPHKSFICLVPSLRLGMQPWEALPALLEAQPLQGVFQVPPGNEIKDRVLA